MAKILVVEDEADIRSLMCLHLIREGHEVIEAEDGEKALEVIPQKDFDLFVVDWMLPGVSGLELCSKLGQKKTPVLMVTAKAHSNDIVEGLEAGADDYVTKPFELSVFLARVKALLRRRNFMIDSSSSGGSPNPRMSSGALLVDIDRHEVKCGDENIELTPSEFKLLIALMGNQGRVLSRKALVALVQGEEVSVVERTVDTHVFGLRKKLGKCAGVIETIRGVGYRIDVANDLQ